MADYSYDQVMTALRNADAAGDAEAATRLAGIAKGLKQTTSVPTEQPSLVDQIPDIGKVPKYEEQSEDTWLGSLTKDTQKLGALGSPFAGPLEAGANLLTGMVAPIGGWINLAEKAIYSAISGKQVNPAEDPFLEGMDSMTYSPRTALGKKIQSDLINPLIENVLIPLGPMAGGFTPHIPQKIVKSVERTLKSPTPEMITKPINDKILAQKIIDQVEPQIKATEDRFEGYANGTISVKDAAEVEHLATLKETLEKIRDDNLGILKGETKEEAIQRGIDLKNKTDEIKAKRQQSYETEPDLEANASNEKLREQQIYRDWETDRKSVV